MQFSETILAAMIGAMATVATALFQLFNVLRTRTHTDARPRKGSTTRSVLSVVALMVASCAGGFLYSELRHERAEQDLRAVGDKLSEQAQLLSALKDRLDRPAQPLEKVAMRSVVAEPQAAEAVLYVPACDEANCNEAASRDFSLCASVPDQPLQRVELFAKAADAVAAEDQWTAYQVDFEQDVGGGKFSGAPQVHPQGDRKAVCVAFLHWSEQAHVARMRVSYGPDPLGAASNSQVAGTVVPTHSPIPAPVSAPLAVPAAANAAL
jgi:hypothetical protein